MSQLVWLNSPPPPEIIAQYAKSKTTSLFNKLMESYVYIDWQWGPLYCRWQYWSRIFFLHLILISTRFPAAGLSTSHIRADWLYDWSSAAKWAGLLITYLVAALSNT